MKKTLLIGLILITRVLQAQEVPQNYSFSLDQAISHAISHNYSALNANRDIAMAKKKKWETTAMGLPQISAGLDYQNNFELQKSLIPAQFFGGQPGEFKEVAFGTKHNMNARSTWSQIIFDGSYIVALQASKTYLKYYENAQKNTVVSVKEMVINTYGNVLLAEESLAILKKNKATMEKTLFETNEIFKNGLIEEENVEQLQITLAIINSNLTYTERLVEIARKMLKVSLGMELTDSLVLTDKLDQLSVANMDLAFAQTEFKLANNVNYRMAQNFSEQRQLELKLEKSKYLPSMYANLNFGYNAFNNQFAFFEPIKNLDPSWFGLPLLINKKYILKKNKFLNYLNKNGIETRPILSGNFVNQSSIKLYKINYNLKTLKNSQEIEERGFFIGLPTQIISLKKLKNLTLSLLNIDNI
jgi:outer membrane protein TolC